MIQRLSSLPRHAGISIALGFLSVVSAIAQAPQVRRESAVEFSMCRQGPEARSTAGALSCTPNRFHGGSLGLHLRRSVLSSLTGGHRSPALRGVAGIRIRCAMHSSVLTADVGDACRRGAYVRRVRGASSIRHSSVVAATSFPVLAPQTRYRAFPPPWFRIVTFSRLRGSLAVRRPQACVMLLTPMRRRTLV